METIKVTKEEKRWQRAIARVAYMAQVSTETATSWEQQVRRALDQQYKVQGAMTGNGIEPGNTQLSEDWRARTERRLKEILDLQRASDDGQGPPCDAFQRMRIG